MRRVVDILVWLAVITVAVVVVRSRQSQQVSIATEAEVRESLSRLYERTSYFGALQTATQESRTLWPVEVMPGWFGDELPRNGLLPGVDKSGLHGHTAAARPWLDIAPPGDFNAHPPDPVAVRLDQAQFWYNPNVGVFRARVAPHLGEDDALKLYNQLNGIELAALRRDTDPARRPLAYTPGTTPSATLASVESNGVRSDSATSRQATSSLFMSDAAPPTYDELIPEPEPTPVQPRGRARLKNQ